MGLMKKEFEEEKKAWMPKDELDKIMEKVEYEQEEYLLSKDPDRGRLLDACEDACQKLLKKGRKISYGDGEYLLENGEKGITVYDRLYKTTRPIREIDCDAAYAAVRAAYESHLTRTMGRLETDMRTLAMYKRLATERSVDAMKAMMREFGNGADRISMPSASNVVISMPASGLPCRIESVRLDDDHVAWLSVHSVFATGNDGRRDREIRAEDFQPEALASAAKAMEEVFWDRYDKEFWVGQTMTGPI